MSDWIKKAKLEIKRRKEEKVRLRMEEIEDQIRREKEEIEDQIRREIEEKELKLDKKRKKLRTEEKYFRRRIQQDIQDVMDEGNTSVDILRNVNNIKELRRQYLELNARIDNVFGNEYEDEFLQIHNEQNKYKNDFIQLLLQKSQQNRLAETTFIEENEKEKHLMEEELHKRKQEEQINSLMVFLKISENVVIF